MVFRKHTENNKLNANACVICSNSLLNFITYFGDLFLSCILFMYRVIRLKRGFREYEWKKKKKIEKKSTDKRSK